VAELQIVVVVATTRRSGNDGFNQAAFFLRLNEQLLGAFFAN
jgi:hypothetical protein